VKYQFSDVRNAFDFVSLGRPLENEAHLDRETGTIYWQSDHADLSDTLPDDIGNAHRYVPIPHKTDLGLGKPLAIQFTTEYLPAQLVSVRELFSRPGAYARFKELLVQQEMLNAWHTYEQDSCDLALRQWCADHGVALQDERWTGRAH